MSIEAYIAARATYVQVNASLDGLASTIGAVGKYLTQNRARFSFSNTGHGLPMEALMGRDCMSADGDAWPSAAQIMESLSQWHAAKNNVLNAWSSLTADQRAALQPPPFQTGR
ncbi:hypothetical protein F4V91_08785 [Neorhizobium galegae]|uniref:Uncharacterized protein n=1 Tax=Neorhizobium galegae TaxID=399 RepID=A0A6A1TSH2_NEOGA|nr:hypothetical protein [Neorhizobium galegae]KAB1086514.1 hypothetical protein F4V91_08785 [Neorhizobium galegae]